MIERIAHYKILKELGSGAMGKVFKAVDESLNMLVAIKVLDPAIASDESNLVRFEREARAAANLKHQHIAHVFFVGRTADNLPFYAMEYVDGQPLQDIIDHRTIITGRQMLTIMKQSCLALQFSSDKGVLHRDIKPGNIMIEREIGVKIVDFGIAKTTSDRETKLTSTGMGLGTPTYVSPEQAQSLDIDFRADMYSLGITFFELLTGSAPYKAETLVNVIIKHMRDPIPDIQSLNPRFPRQLCQIIERMMAKKPEGRYSSFEEIHDALERVLVSEHEFVDSSWAWCEHCDIVDLVQDGSLCFRCKQSLEAPDEEVTYMAVYLNAMNGPDARQMVSHYMQKNTGRSLEAISVMLQNLPLMLAPRLPYENAKAIQSKLYQLGAEVSLKKVAVGKIKKGQARPRLEFGLERRRDATTKLDTMRSHVKESAKKPVPLYLAVALLFVAVVGLGSYFLVEYSGNEKPVIDNKTSAAETTENEAPGTVEDAKAPAENAEGSTVMAEMTAFSSRNGLCRFNIIEFGESATLEKLGVLCETQVKELKYSYGLYKLEAPLFIIDGRKDFALMLPTLGLDLQADADGMPLFAKWLNTDRTEAAAVMRAALARNLLRQVAGGQTLPSWLENGFALSEVRKSQAAAYDPEKDMADAAECLVGGLWDTAFEEGSPRAYAQSALYAAWLNGKSPDSIMRIARQMAQGNTFEKAFLRVFYKSHDEMLKLWFDEYSKN